MKTRKDKRMIEFEVFKTALFGHIYKRSHSLFGAWSFLLIYIWLTPGEGPKGFVN